MIRRRDWIDVSIEGVGLVANYRTQLNTIIQTAADAELVRKMKTQQGELLATDGAPSTPPAPAKGT